MAGKEKKPKLIDSPSLIGATANNKTGVANTIVTNIGGTTPKGTKTRGRRSAIAVPLDETSNASTELESVLSMEDVEENSNQTPDSPTSKTRKTGKNITIVNEDGINEDEDNETTVENTESPRTSKRGAKKTTKAKVVKKLGLNKKAIVISKRKTPLGVTGRKGRGKTVRTKRRHSIGEVEMTKTEEDASSELTKTLRNGKPRADSPSGMKKRVRLLSDTRNSMPEPIVKPELIKTEAPASDSEVVVAGRGRRRSDSLSKCSDTTDTSSFCDQISLQKSPSKLSQTSASENNNDGSEQVPDKLKILDKMSQSFNSADAIPNEVVAAVDTAKFVRRSTRQRRSVVTPTPMSSPALIQVKTEPKEEEILVSSIEMPLDEASLPAMSSSSPPPVLEKADSVSPEPDVVDQNNRALHVKQFYGQPVFMENNVGIESDPSLGEIITQAPLLEKQPSVVETEDEVCQPAVEENVSVEDPMDSVPLAEINVMIVVNKAKESEAVKANTEEVETPIQAPVEESQDIMEEVLPAPEVPLLIDNGHDESDVDVDVERLDDVAVGDLTFEEERPLIERAAEFQQNSVELPPSISEVMEEVQAGVKEMLDKMGNDDEPPVLSPEEKPVDKTVPMEEETKENVEPIMTEAVKELTESETPPPLLEMESPESLLRKESVMNALGLLTLQAADAAKLERRKQKEQRLLLQQSAGRGAGYTGTLKTVIKLNRGSGSAAGDKRRSRGPLKMTFQKGRGKQTAAQREAALKAELDGTPLDPGQGDGMYYTIQNEMVSGRARQWDTSSHGPELHNDNMAATSGGYTGTTNYTSSDATGSQFTSSSYHNNNALSGGGIIPGAAGCAPLASTEAAKALVIPEKASSFSIHPGRLCRDQCHYCGGKFGLFDTPCHVAQIKSQERQKRILDMEEKLTVDNCLCDACYRHVDRRANCPSYRKRTSATSAGQLVAATEAENNDVGQPAAEAPKPLCRVIGCTEEANNSLRRKWLIKMKKNVSKILQLEPDAPHTPVSHAVPLCRTHYDAVSHLLVCALCKRRLARNHANYLGAAEAARAAGLLGAQGVPAAELGGPNPAAAAVCKLCRYYIGLLMKAEADGGRTPKATFIKSYRRRLLESHNIEVQDESESEDQLIHPFVPGVPGITHKKSKSAKSNVKKSNRKSTESPTDPQSDTYEFNASLPTENKDDLDDIENIISKNTIQITRNPDLSANINCHQKLNENGLQKAGPSLLLANLSNSTHKKIRLDEILSQQQTAEQLKAEKVQQLRSNPSLSVRELFPGEEEMGLHANIPLNRGGPRTPEGWTRCTTTIQYDEETRRLWNKLQEPYGNMSSFLRHLILLEKYFRSGDLILSQNATSSATNYSESVQNRLRSFDYIPSNNVEVATAFRPNLTVTKKSASATSQVINPLAHIPSMSLTPASNEITQLAKRLKLDKKSPANIKQNESDSSSIRHNSAFIKPNRKPEESKQKRSPSVPPDLISIGSKGSTSAAPIAALKRASLPSTSIESPVTAALKIPALSAANTNNTLKVSLSDTAPAFVSASLAMQAVAAVTSVPSATTTSTVYAATSGSSLTVVPVSSTVPMTSLNSTTTITPEAAPVPTEPAKKTNPAGSKPWRPTLIPIDPNSEPPNTGQLFQTVDGRRLPSLVQVMSGGKPYHISIQDYNRMCILRRQKVVQMQKNQLLQKLKDQQKPDSKISVEIKNTFPSGNKKKVDIPNKVLEQNSVIPIRGNETNKGKKTVNALLKNLPQLNKNLTVARTSVSGSTNSTLTNSSQKSDNSISITTEDGYWAWDAVKKQRISEESNKSQMETMLSKIPKSLTVIPQKSINRTNSTSPLSVQPLTPSNLLKNQDENNP